MSDWALYSDGSNDVISIGSAITVSLGTWQGVFLYEGRVLTPSGTVGIAGTSSSSTVAGPAVTTAGAMVIRSSANITIATSPDGFVIFDEYHVYEFQHDSGGAWRFVRDGETISSGTYTGAATWTNINQFFRATSAASARLNAYTKRISFTGVTNGQDWDADLSGGTGSTLPTVSGSNQGTLVNFPTDNSQWIDTAPSGSVSASIDYSVPAPQYSASASATATGVSASIDYSVPAPQYSASASATAPGVSASVAYSVPAPQYTASASATAPGFSASVSYSVPSPVYSASASATAPGFSASVSYTVPAPQYTASASATAPVLSASVAYTVPAPQYTASASATVAGFSAAVSYSVPAPVYNASASSTAPVLSASIAYSVPAPRYQAYATPQEQLITVARGANITYTAKSRSLTYTAASRDIRS